MPVRHLFNEPVYIHRQCGYYIRPENEQLLRDATNHNHHHHHHDQHHHYNDDHWQDRVLNYHQLEFLRNYAQVRN